MILKLMHLVHIESRLDEIDNYSLIAGKSQSDKIVWSHWAAFLIGNQLSLTIDALILCGKLLSAFFAPTANNISAANAWHAIAETVLILSLPIAGLISSLHYISKFRPGKYIYLIQNQKEIEKGKK